LQPPRIKEQRKTEKELQEFLKQKVERVSKTWRVVKAIPEKRLSWLCFAKAPRSEMKKEELALLRYIDHYCE
jgi:hypothetical protein